MDEQKKPLASDVSPGQPACACAAPFFRAAAKKTAELLNSPAAGNCFLVLAVMLILCGLWLIIFRAPTLLEIDSYYHVGVANIILRHGFISEFPWTQFSLMKNFYADKDLLLHLLIVPFAFLIKNPVLAGKFALAFMEAGALASFAYLLRKHVNGFLAGLLLILLFTSPIFMIYFLYLRPGTLAALFTVAGMYFMVKKRHWPVFIIGALFSLAHISSFTLIYFAVMCETVRWLRDREFHVQIPVFAATGVALGLLVHPNCPNNMLVIYVNAFLTPYYAAVDKSINFAGELNANTTRRALLENFPIMAGLAVFIMTGFWNRFRQSTATAIYLCAAGTYMLLASSSNRFWFPAEPLMVLALASLAADRSAAGVKTTRSERINIGLILAVMALLLGYSAKYSKNYLVSSMNWQKTFNADHEQAARWMARHLPPGDTVYHANWADSPHFICLNPANRYITVLDPIYTYYWSRQAQHLMQAIEQGNHPDPHTEIRETFKARYVFTATNTGFYKQISRDRRFKLLHASSASAIFELEPPAAPQSKGKN
ncbi:MAG: hypothetical protein PHW69_08710 [Elusimicrobiaceae bacterium]|nr:hypothetical protein [Elusimicrobiaceae bacterium]